MKNKTKKIENKEVVKEEKKVSRRIILKDLLKRITPENRHEEVDWGEPVGREIW